MVNGLTSSRKKWIYAILSVFLMLIYGTVYSWSIFRVSVEESLGVGTMLSGLPYMVFLFMYALSMAISGQIIDKYSVRRILIIGGFFIFAGWILSSLSKDIFSLTISYGLIIGTGVGISYGVPIYVMAKWFPNKKGMIVGIVLAGFGLSPLITAPLGNRMIKAVGLNSTFLYFGILFGLLILLLALPMQIPKDKKESISEDYNTEIKVPMLKKKSFKFAYTCFLIGTLIGLSIIGLTSNIGKEMVGLKTEKIALLMTFFALANGIGRPLFGWMTEKYGPLVSMRVSYMSIILASIGMVFIKEVNIILFFIIFFVLWLNLGAWLSIAPIMTMKLYGMEFYTKNYGIMFTAYGIGAVIGVITTGMMVDYFSSYRMIFIFIVAVSLIGFMLAGKVKRK